MSTEIDTLLQAPAPVTRERIHTLRDAIGEMPQVDCPIRHFFAGGLYAREMFIPAGVCAVGKLHRFDQITMVLGDITMVTPGEEPVRINTCEPFVSPAGIERAAYAHVDSFITTFHHNPDDLRDPDELVAKLTAPDSEALFFGKKEAKALL